MACHRTHVFLGINQINMYLFLLLLIIVLIILFVPILGPTVKLALLSLILVVVIGFSILILVRSAKSTPSPSVPDIQPCSASSPSYCQECNSNPCRCAEILPGQQECPKCRGKLCTGAVQGIQNCGGCGRGYRCPGCLLSQ